MKIQKRASTEQIVQCNSSYGILRIYPFVRRHLPNHCNDGSCHDRRHRDDDENRYSPCFYSYGARRCAREWYSEATKQQLNGLRNSSCCKPAGDNSTFDEFQSTISTGCFLFAFRAISYMAVESKLLFRLHGLLTFF